ncbi:MAG: winged helix-turn-helix domain-containing protein [Acidobacteriota bacterium]|nr:winged helix-turn-helix domain-containing protein [Acidobacteriota bacterium]
MSSNLSSIQPQFNLNSVKTNCAAIYEFEKFRLDSACLMLYRADQHVSLAPKVVETLLALVERAGEIVSKGEIMERVWKDAFVEESNLTQNIYLLRKMLGKTSDGKDLIETFRRRGYRFNGDLKSPNRFSESLPETVDLLKPVIETDSVDQNTPPSFTAKKTFFQKNKWIAAAIVVVLLIAGFALTRSNWRERTNAAEVRGATADATLKRLTPDIYAYNPAISPDGRYLAYVEIKDKKNSVWLKDIAHGSAVQILQPLAAGYKSLQFSPDGAELYFLTKRENVPNGTIARISLAGDKTPTEIIGDSISPIAVSPDAAKLAFINGQGNLILVNRDGSGERILKKPAEGKWFRAWDSAMSLSPDGEKIAVCGGYLENGRNVYEILEISLIDGSERRIATPTDWREMDDIVWLRDGKTLFVTVRESQGQPFQIWRLSYPDGEVKRITNNLNDYHYFTVTSDGKTIVAEQSLANLNVWTAVAKNVKNVEQATFGKFAKDGQAGVAVMPDSKVVYSSIRSGNVDLWVTDPDGSNQRQLTANAGTNNSRPRSTPDGRNIVFVSSRTGSNHIWRMDADGGNPKQLTFGDGNKTRPAISPDGAWVFYTSDEGTEKSSIWKVPIDGGEPRRISVKNLAWGAVVSPNGKFIAYNHNQPEASHPWKIGLMSENGGEPLKLFDLDAFWGILEWTADSKSILYINSEDGNLWQQPIDDVKPRPFTHFKTDRILNFALSPDRSRIAFSRGFLTTEAILITDF